MYWDCFINDVFDCIDKKSLYKESTFTYDYEPLTTQRYVDIDKVEIFVAGETSDDGVCPKNCAQCMENKKCKLCINGYNLIGSKENDDQPIICDNEIDLLKGYYKKDNIYYPCHNKCETCSLGPISDDEMNCDTCKEDYVIDGKNCLTEEEKKKRDDKDKEKQPMPNNTIYVIIICVVCVFFILVTIIIIIKIRRKRNIDNKIEDIKNSFDGKGNYQLY